ncbi:MAG: type II toxin-antitoxin system HicB family antitoxin [Candidatus Methylumidiphilus sp.]
MKYQVVFEQSEEGFAVSIPSLPGCHSQGLTKQEALENIMDAIREYSLAMQELNHSRFQKLWFYHDQTG